MPRQAHSMMELKPVSLASDPQSSGCPLSKLRASKRVKEQKRERDPVCVQKAVPTMQPWL